MLPTVTRSDRRTIGSSQGRLVPAAFNSLSDQAALGGSWIEANPQAARISELKNGGVGSLNAGASIALGAIYNPLAGAFGATEDLVIQFNTASGLVEGVVNYTGTKVNNLLLQVDPTSGQARLRNTSATTVAIEGYALKSADGSLLQNSWTSLDDQNIGGGDWIEFGTKSANLLGELPPSSLTLAPGANFALGSIFNAAKLKDLSFEFLLTGETTPSIGTVAYTTIAATQGADFDSDGDVDGADFLSWQRGFGIAGSAVKSQGDANGDGAVSGADLSLWKSQFGTGLSNSTAAAIPEPQSIVVGIGLMTYCFKHLRRGRRGTGK